MKVVAVYNVKGGVGKTAISVNLAHCSATAGHRTLLWDLDEQGGASSTLGREVSVGARKVRRTYEIRDHLGSSGWEGIDLISADSLVHLLDRHDRPTHLRELLDRVRNRYDYVILDCPPTLGVASDQILQLADLIVVPIVPSRLARAGFDQLQAHARQTSGPSPAFLPVHSMVDRRRRAHQDALEADPNWPAVPYSSVVERSAASRDPVARLARNSPAAQAMRSLWTRIEQDHGN